MLLRFFPIWIKFLNEIRENFIRQKNGRLRKEYSKSANNSETDLFEEGKSILDYLNLTEDYTDL